MDLRDMKSELQGFIKLAKENDNNWTWQIKKILKHKAEIVWGYLDYLGESHNAFIVKYDELAETLAVYTPNDELIDIADTLEDAILIITHYAHSIY